MYVSPSGGLVCIVIGVAPKPILVAPYYSRWNSTAIVAPSNGCGCTAAVTKSAVEREDRVKEKEEREGGVIMRGREEREEQEQERA